MKVFIFWAGKRERKKLELIIKKITPVKFVVGGYFEYTFVLKKILALERNAKSQNKTYLIELTQVWQKWELILLLINLFAKSLICLLKRFWLNHNYSLPSISDTGLFFWWFCALSSKSFENYESGLMFSVKIWNSVF